MKGVAMRLAWATDLHLNFVEEAERDRFLQSLADRCDAIVITGDIGESHDVIDHLRALERAFPRPIYFVLGNHDFYRGSIARTRAAVADLARSSRHLVYLSAADVVPLTANTALVGHDGWADAQCGDFAGSNVILNDYLLIEELRYWDGDGHLDKRVLGQTLYELGAEAARHFRRTLAAAAADYPQLIAATHVPPFPEAAWYEGQQSDDNYLPHFCCRASGEALREIMAGHPHCNLLGLCGHTHGGGEIHPLPNLRVLTGAARYGSPAVQTVFELD